jgi:hypothetical protein
MATKTLNDTTHKFEAAGLGKAPFRCVGATEKRGPISMQINGALFQVGAPGQPMGTCAYCGQGIAICCRVKSSDGKSFDVGSDCVRKVGDAGLTRKVKTIVATRRREKAHARAVEQKAFLISLLADENIKAALGAKPHPSIPGKTLWDYVCWMRDHAGASGIAKTLKIVSEYSG